MGKTLVSTAMLDRVAANLGRRLYETPVGFKWFVNGLLDGSCGLGGEEIHKIYAESFLSEGHLHRVQQDGIRIVNAAFAEAGAPAA